VEELKIMKTNANPENVIKAVKNVSKNLYGGNVIFRKEPHNITKNVVSFTLKTKNADKAGSITTSNGQKHPKANWEVHLNVAKEIFKLEPKSNIYIDTIAGRLHNDSIPVEETVTTDAKEKFIESLRYVLENKEMLEGLLKPKILEKSLV
jgi:transcription termination factor NusB